MNGADGRDVILKVLRHVGFQSIVKLERAVSESCVQHYIFCRGYGQSQPHPYQLQKYGCLLQATEQQRQRTKALQLSMPLQSRLRDRRRICHQIFD